MTELQGKQIECYTSLENVLFKRMLCACVCLCVGEDKHKPVEILLENKERSFRYEVSSRHCLSPDVRGCSGSRGWDCLEFSRWNITLFIIRLCLSLREQDEGEILSVQSSFDPFPVKSLFVWTFVYMYVRKRQQKCRKLWWWGWFLEKVCKIESSLSSSDQSYFSNCFQMPFSQKCFALVSL